MASSPPSDKDSDIVFAGFKRKVMTARKVQELANDGLAYMGFNDSNHRPRVQTEVLRTPAPSRSLANGQALRGRLSKVDHANASASPTMEQVIDVDADPASLSSESPAPFPPLNVSPAFMTDVDAAT